MFDGFKILSLYSNTDLLNNQYLEFPLANNDKTTEIDNNARFQGLIIRLRNNRFSLYGSLHKYFNKGFHNYNDFHVLDLLNTIQDIHSKFGIDPAINRLNNIEFGVNVISPIPLIELFDSLIQHKGIAFQKFTIKGAKGLVCKHNRYIIKIYAKGIQYKQTKTLLRYEIKVLKMEFFRQYNLNIDTLSDLLNNYQYKALGEVLTKIWDEILFTDLSIDIGILNSKEHIIYAEGNNPKYWEKLIPKSKIFSGGNQNQNYKRQRKKYYRNISRFKKLINNYSNRNLQDEISELICEKWNELTSIAPDMRDKLTKLLIQFQSKTRDKLTTTKNSNKGQNNTLSIEQRICPPPLYRNCLICGINISNKKNNAKYCSKKCKNTHTNAILNPRNNLIKKLERRTKTPGLFDTYSFIKISDKEKEILEKPNTIYN